MLGDMRKEQIRIQELELCSVERGRLSIRFYEILPLTYCECICFVQVLGNVCIKIYV